jgi:16S rRNA (guanine966-N2)-methyltransferase
MRVTGGILRGRLLRGPAAGYRPTQDRVREALCNALAAAIPGARFLDLFAGCGSVGLEAASRGAAAVCWVERHPGRFAALQANVAALRAELDPGVTLRPVRGDALRFLERDGDLPFDIVYADPPYDREGDAGWLDLLLRGLEGHPTLAKHGIFAMEGPTEGPPETAPAGWDCIRDAVYGHTRLRFFRRAHDGAGE